MQPSPRTYRSNLGLQVPLRTHSDQASLALNMKILRRLLHLMSVRAAVLRGAPSPLQQIRLVSCDSSLPRLFKQSLDLLPTP